MESKVHQIQSKQLKPFVQYILYNRHNEATPDAVTSFPNTNICLGISKGNVLIEREDGFESEQRDPNDIFVYTTGLYTAPHKFKVEQHWDEVCIDFHPCGYYHFFNVPSKSKIINEAFTDHFFSQEDRIYFHDILNEKDLTIRSLAIENFLLSKLQPFDQSNLQVAIAYIHLKNGILSVKELMQYTKCSKRKLYRLFMDHFSITPKWYIRIVKIRQALQLITSNPTLSLTEIAYRCGYTDQSHFIKETKMICNVLPKTLRNDLISIDNEVLISSS